MPAVEHSYRVRLRPVGTAPRIARDVLATVCADWGAPGFLEAGRLVLSELVSNAVLHSGAQAGGRMDGHGADGHDVDGSSADGDGTVGLELSLLPDGALLMRVHDDGPDLPRVVASPRGAAGGHGLGIVSRLTESWGVEVDQRGGGKTVWCVLRARPAGSGVPAASGH